jgi:hypothetical protein
VDDEVLPAIDEAPHLRQPSHRGQHVIARGVARAGGGEGAAHAHCLAAAGASRQARGHARSKRRAPAGGRSPWSRARLPRRPAPEAPSTATAGRSPAPEAPSTTAAAAQAASGAKASGLIAIRDTKVDKLLLDMRTTKKTTFTWSWSTDGGETWSAGVTTGYAKADIQNLPPATYQFRVFATVGKVPGEPCQPVGLTLR